MRGLFEAALGAVTTERFCSFSGKPHMDCCSSVARLPAWLHQSTDRARAA